MKRYLFAFAAFLVLQSCAFDGPVYVQTVVGRMAIHYTEDPPNASLEYYTSDMGTHGLLDGCAFIAVGKANKVVYAEKTMTKTSSAYYIYKLLDPGNEDVYRAFTTNEADKAEFKRMVAACTGCKVLLKDGHLVR